MEPIRKNSGKPLGISVSDKAKKMPVVDTDGRFKTKNKKHSTKVTKKVHIKDYTMDTLYVHVSWHTLPLGQMNELEVCRQQFEQWLADTGRLDWYMEGYDGEGMEQVYGTMAVDDYWENADLEVKQKDLNDYITTHNLI